MPGKSRSQKERKHFKPVTVTQQPVSAVPPALQVTINVPAPPMKTTYPQTGTPVPAAKPATAASADVNIKRELLSISLLSGIMLVVLILASIILH